MDQQVDKLETGPLREKTVSAISHHADDSVNGTSEDIVHSNPSDIGKDMWNQLERICIPTFTGKKDEYESWQETLSECIDQAPATNVYKVNHVNV